MFSADRIFNEFFNDPFFNPRPRLTDSSGAQALAKRNPDFADGILSHWYSGFNVPEVQNPINVEEQPDKYVVSVSGAGDKEFKVDFLKKENQLHISTSKEIKEKDEKTGSERSFSSSALNTVGFDKAVKFDEIKADVKEDTLVIEVPKAVVDEENIVPIAIEGSKTSKL